MRFLAECAGTVPAQTAPPLASRYTLTRTNQENTNGRRRRRHQDDQGQRGQVRRPAFYGHARQGAARDRSGESVRRQQIQRRSRFRRVFDRRLERHPGVRHAADAGPRFRQPRPVHRRAHAHPHVRRRRAFGRQRLRPRPALDRQARRGVSEVERHRRHRLLRSRARILHLRLGDVERRHVGLRTSKIKSEEAPWSSGEDFEGGNMGHRPAIKGGYFPVPPVDSLQDIRSAMCLAHGGDGRRSRSASPRSRGARPVRDRHQVQQPGASAPTGTRS